MSNVANWDVASIDTAGTITANGGFVGDVTGDVIGDLTGNVTGQVFGTVGSYTATAPAIPLTVSYAFLDASSNAVAATLADGTQGQVITVTATDVTNATTLVPANLTGGTTITFTAVNDSVTLVFDVSTWNVVSLSGSAAVS